MSVRVPRSFDRETGKEQGVALSDDEYKQSCAAWMVVDCDAGENSDFCASCIKGIVGATCGATWGRM